MRCRVCKQEIPEDSQTCPFCNANIANTSDNNPLKYIIIILLLVIIVLFLIIIINSKSIPKSIYIEDDSSFSPSGTRTIMLYLAGSNLESNASLATYELNALDPKTFDFTNNHLLVYTGGSKKWHNFVSSNENAIYEFTKDKGFVKLKTLSRLNMGDPDTLTEFLNYGYHQYETDSYNLIIWDHGGATNGAVYDEISGDHLELEEFSKALKNSPFNTNNKLETVLFRTCLNGTFEMANIFKDYAKYLIASEEKTQGSTKANTMSFLNKVSKSDSAIDYGTKFIEQYANQLNNIKSYREDNNSIDVMYSIVDLSYIGRINKAFDKYISAVALEENYSDIVRLRNNLFQYGYVYYDDKMYDTVDMYTLIEELSPYSSVSPEELLKLIDAAVIYNWTNIEESKGIAIFFPFNSSPKEQINNLTAYSKLPHGRVYLDFIQAFRNRLVSKSSTSYKQFGLTHNKVSYDSNLHTMTIELNSDQVRDYLKSEYMIFRKDKDLLNLVYTSDNVIEPSDNDKTIVAILEPKLVGLKDKNQIIVLPIEERKYKNEIIKSASIDFLSLAESGQTLFPTVINIKYGEKSPTMSAAYFKDKKSTASSQLLELKDINNMSVTNDYYINRNNKLILEGTEQKTSFVISNTSWGYLKLDSNYCGVFVITDIYGNTYYTDLINF